MKPSQKSLTYLISGVALLTLSAGAFAFGGHGRHGHGCHGDSPLRAVYRLPDLTDAQRTQLDTLRKQERKRMRADADMMRDNRRKLHDAITDGADRATIRQLAKQEGTQVTAMIMDRVEARDRVEAILTAKQRKELHLRGSMGPSVQPQ